MGKDSKKKKKQRSRSSSPKGRERRHSSSPEYESRRHGKKKSRDDRKKEKELIKALETPEEKRARRLAKKQAKEIKKRKEMGWDDEELKHEKEGTTHLSEAEKVRRNQLKREEMKRELASVKRRRQEREQERMAREDERNLLVRISAIGKSIKPGSHVPAMLATGKELMQREKEGAYYKEWEKQEDMFHIEQARLRSKIRIRDGRAKPIDLLAQYINPDEDDLEYQMHEPYSVLVGLSLDDLGDLIEDMKLYLEIDEGKNHQFWQDMLTVTRNEDRKLKKQDPNKDQFHERRETINSSVNTDIEKIFRGKTSAQLSALRNQINQKITGGGTVDIGYWESLLQQLNVFMAKSRLREKHQKMLKEKLATLKREAVVESPSGTTESGENVDDNEDGKNDGDNWDENLDEKEYEKSSSPDKKKVEDEEKESTAEKEDAPNEEKKTQDVVYSEEELIARGYKAYEEGRYSPLLIRFSDVDQEKLVDPDKDLMDLEDQRERIVLEDSVTVDAGSSGVDLRTMEASKDMGADEETFNVPVPLGQKKYLWQDKYRPRKPRFFNRVHTGYEWNKYNQTHYDMDNPPPKIVQGYKFNQIATHHNGEWEVQKRTSVVQNCLTMIFYPDLIDKTETPQYYLEPCSGEKDFAILRFHSGPPYEDIAFKVVNREWEYSHKHGFRSQFHNGVFQLWFHFKRYRYRR